LIVDGGGGNGFCGKLHGGDFRLLWVSCHLGHSLKQFSCCRRLTRRTGGYFGLRIWDFGLGDG
jgi:hypothetical protein